MRSDHTLFAKIVSLSIISLSVYTALYISRIPPHPWVLVSSILVVIGYILLSFNIIWIMRIKWEHLLVLIVLFGISSIIGLIDIVLLYVMLTISILSIIAIAYELSMKYSINDIVGNKYVVIMILTYYLIATAVLLVRFTPIIPEALGLAELRRILSIMLVSKIFYMLVSLFIVALIYSIYRDSMLFSRGAELRRQVLKESLGLVERILHGRDGYYMVIVEAMLLIIGILVYPIILFFLAQLHLFIGGFIYVIGIILTYIAWIVLRILAYKLFSISYISVDEAKKILLGIWITIAMITLFFGTNPLTSSIVASTVRYPVEPSQYVSLFNRFYTNIIDLEFNAIKLLVELLWG